MFKKLNFKEFSELAKLGQNVAVYLEAPGDNLTPISAYQTLGELSKGATLLESSPNSGQQARFSFIGIDPIAHCDCKNDHDALEKLKAFHQQQHCTLSHSLSGFLGGVVGFISYDAVRTFEKLPDRHQDEVNLPDFAFTSYKSNITFDHHTNKIIITHRVKLTDNPEADFEKAINILESLAKQLQTPTNNSSSTKKTTSNPVEVDIDDETYCQMVEKAKRYIEAGDVFQVVISRRFQKKLSVTPFEVYRALRMASPAPYLFYIDRGDTVITGASPEKLIAIEDGEVSSFPIAGTRPRSEDPEQNALMEEELLNDEKETAEHVMLVDLARNDLGRTCEPGSVIVKSFKHVQNFSHVMHITSEVIGTVRKGTNPFDVLKAAFPAGTLSGAPKIRAMEIIDELESSKRGAYGGVICFVDNNSNLNSCITIRTAVIKDGIATIRAGGGIVYDSNPQAEADETRHKARSVLSAIEIAEGGLA